MPQRKKTGLLRAEKTNKYYGTNGERTDRERKTKNSIWVGENSSEERCLKDIVNY